MHDVSVVLPVFGNAATLQELHERLDRALGERLLEAVYVDDASTDGSLGVLRSLAAADPRVVLVERAANGGQQRALLDGLARARGSWVVTLDADLQDPPEAVPDLLAAAPGRDVVFGGRRGRYSSPGRRVTSRAYKNAQALLTGLPRDASTFVALSADAAARVVALDRGDRAPSLPGMVAAAVPGPAASVPVARELGQQSGFTGRARVDAGVHGLCWGLEARQMRRHERLSASERDAHPWSQGRRRVVAAQLDRLDIPPGATALDAGCGGGLLLAELDRRAEAYGVDADEESVALARAAVGRDRVEVARLEALPFPDARFDLVLSMDVLEHLDDDRAALRELRRVTRPGGRLLVSVPALPVLFSSHDVAAGHRRRYSRRDLVAAAHETGWRLGEVTSFNTLLLPVAAAARLATRRSPPASDIRRAHGPAARTIALALGFEARLLRAGVRLPIGLSLLAVFERDG